MTNQRRKGCTTWTTCTAHPDCKLVIWTCIHDPPCIRAIPGATQAEVAADPASWIHPLSTDLQDLYERRLQLDDSTRTLHAATNWEKSGLGAGLGSVPWLFHSSAYDEEEESQEMEGVEESQEVEE